MQFEMPRAEVILLGSSDVVTSSNDMGFVPYGLDQNIPKIEEI